MNEHRNYGMTIRGAALLLALLSGNSKGDTSTGYYKYVREGDTIYQVDWVLDGNQYHVTTGHWSSCRTSVATVPSDGGVNYDTCEDPKAVYDSKGLEIWSGSSNYPPGEGCFDGVWGTAADLPKGSVLFVKQGGMAVTRNRQAMNALEDLLSSHGKLPAAFARTARGFFEKMEAYAEKNPDGWLYKAGPMIEDVMGFASETVLRALHKEILIPISYADKIDIALTSAALGAVKTRQGSAGLSQACNAPSFSCAKPDRTAFAKHWHTPQKILPMNMNKRLVPVARKPLVVK